MLERDRSITCAWRTAIKRSWCFSFLFCVKNLQQTETRADGAELRGERTTCSAAQGLDPIQDEAAFLRDGGSHSSPPVAAAGTWRIAERIRRTLSECHSGPTINCSFSPPGLPLSFFNGLRRDPIQYWTVLHQIFKIGTHMGGMINLTFSRSLYGRCYGNRILAPIGKKLHTKYNQPGQLSLSSVRGR